MRSTGFGSVLRGIATLATLLTLTSCALFPSERRVTEAPAVAIEAAGPFMPEPPVTLSDVLAADFAHLQPELAGTVGMAIMPVGGGQMALFGDWNSGIAWSTIKVPLAIAALRHDHREWIVHLAEAAITASDNSAAEALWWSLGNSREAAAAVQAVLDEASTGAAGVEHTMLNYTAFGGTEWTLANQVRFAAQLPCLPETHRVPEMMASITPDQAWGLGVLAGTAFKGGWGPDDTTGVYTVRQFGLVPALSGTVAVALAAQADSGTFADSTAILSRLSELLGRHLHELNGGSCPPSQPISPE
ncbi:hypothetical protein ACL02S_13490 [Nocardia sp. 004]|uniref:hypothetical protein n=1 Tax=Nocardia sp. 004 TaxID=3385978 RepID=UPI0039A1EB7F